MLRALQVSHRAAHLAGVIADQPNPACSWGVRDGAFRYDFDLLLERRGPGKVGVSARWHEKRSLRRDAAGRLDLRMQADFRVPTMAAAQTPGRRAMRWMIADDTSYLSDDLDEDTPEFYRRKSNFGAREKLVFSGLSTIQTLLDAVPQGWKRVPGSGAVWKPGGAKLKCMMGLQGLHNGTYMRIQARSTEDNWRREFGEQSTLLDASFKVDRVPNGSSAEGEKFLKDAVNTRQLELQWRLQDGATLRAVFHDTVSEFDKPIVLPQGENIVEVERDRSLFWAKKRLDTWRENGWVIPSNEVEKP